MIQVIQSIFSALSIDTLLTQKLTDDGLGNPAIYSSWGLRDSGPYIIISYLPSNEEYYNQNSMDIQIDIFDRGDQEALSYVRCYEIRQDIVRILDGYKDDFGGNNIRCYYTSEQPILEDEGRYRRYMISFESRYNRTFDV